jgi:hypothetical protein
MRILSWAFAVRALFALALFGLGAEWGRRRASLEGHHAAGTVPDDSARGPRGSRSIAAARPPTGGAPGTFGPRGASGGQPSDAWPLPSAPFEWCWPKAEDCAIAGLCKMPDPFQPRVTPSQLAKCSRLSTDDSKGKVLQLYHVSKCGGE